jgi:hypothetical protein
LTLFSVFWVTSKYLAWTRSRSHYSTASRLFKVIKADLRERVGGIGGLSQTDMLRTYLKFPRQDYDALKRDEETFFKIVWPRLEAERKRDKAIKSYERMQFGKEVPVWTLS